MNRLDENGRERELHVEQAAEAIDFEDKNPAKTEYSKIRGKSSKIISCPYFETNIIEFETIFEKNYDSLDSFVIYVCTEGNFTIKYPNVEDTEVKTGETVLLPAEMSEIQLISETKCIILEVFIENRSIFKS
jgi:mannose-6-phosphate isomerase